MSAVRLLPRLLAAFAVAVAVLVTSVVTAPAASAATSWGLTASTSGTNPVNISSAFTAPSGFGTKSVRINTEVTNSAGNKVAQWHEVVTISSDQTVRRSYSWSTTGKAAGTYQVKQGTFSSNWSTKYSFRHTGVSFKVGSTTSTSGNPLASANGFYANPYSQAANIARDWKYSRPGDAAYLDRIAKGGAATWLGGWNSNVQADVNNVVTQAVSQGQTPVFVAYNIPGRDCGHYSAGGLSGPSAYNSWIAQIKAGINGRKAAVILEPDALPQLDCLSSTAKAERLSMLKNAVNTLSASGTAVYLDAGHSGWHTASTMADRLNQAGVSNARGFALNVSNFQTTSSSTSYGEQISNLTGGKRYVVDTSRNGNGSNGEWCNPSGRALGQTPSINTGVAHADAYIWIKQPGESDGNCNGGPSAGQFWAEYAIGLAKNAG